MADSVTFGDVGKDRSRKKQPHAVGNNSLLLVLLALWNNMAPDIHVWLERADNEHYNRDTGRIEAAASVGTDSSHKTPRLYKAVVRVTLEKHFARCAESGGDSSESLFQVSSRGIESVE